MHSQQQRMLNVLIAGGGSGGHVAPAIAAAEVLTQQGATVLLAHSSRKIDREMLSDSTFEGIVLPASPFSTTPIGFVHFCFGFLKSSQKVRTLIKERSIGCVLATGGFVAAPALYAARKEGCKTVLLNLDDPPGRANKLAVRWADTILSTVNCTLRDAVLIAPPLRESVINNSIESKCKATFGLLPNKMTLLITGASQGASTINQLLPALAIQNPSMFNGWEILHIAGTAHVEDVERAWKEANVPCKVIGFTQSMGDAWGAADLAVTRGGANTIAEIAMNAVPSIVMPYPYHNDDHQRTNAIPLEKIGGIVIAKDHKNLSENLGDGGNQILHLLSDQQRRFNMRQSMLTAVPSNGADTIAAACLKK